MEQEKILREKERKEEALRKKAEAAVAREAWLLEREKEIIEQESNDMDAGRFRLADLNDSDNEFYYKKKGKKGKKMKKKQDLAFCELPDNNDQNDINKEREGVDVQAPSESEALNHVDLSNTNIDPNHRTVEEGDIIDEMLAHDLADFDFGDEILEDSSEEEDLEIFKCECCRKTFKSDKQLENHENSKKHKEAYKKWMEREY